MTFQSQPLGLPCPAEHTGCALAVRVVNLRWSMEDVLALVHDLHIAGHVSSSAVDLIAQRCAGATAGELIDVTGRLGARATTEGVPDPGPMSINGHVTVGLD